MFSFSLLDAIPVFVNIRRRYCPRVMVQA